jgi:hypothetical protein
MSGVTAWEDTQGGRGDHRMCFCSLVRCNWAMMKTLCDVFEFMIMWEQQMYDSEYQQKVLDVRR